MTEQKQLLFCVIMIMALACGILIVWISGGLRDKLKKLAKKSQDNDRTQGQGILDMDRKLRCRISDHRGSSEFCNNYDFAIRNVDVHPNEYFEYFIQGLGYPLIEQIEIKEMTSSYRNLYITAVVCNKVGKRYISFWGHYSEKDSRDFMKKLYSVMTDYSLDTDYEAKETIDSIIKRARGEYISKEEEMEKYGYRWE